MSYMGWYGILAYGPTSPGHPGPASLIYTQFFALILQLWEAIDLDIYMLHRVPTFKCAFWKICSHGLAQALLVTSKIESHAHCRLHLPYRSLRRDSYGHSSARDGET